MTFEMRDRLLAQAEANGGLSLNATIRLGLHRWLAAAERSGRPA